MDDAVNSFEGLCNRRWILNGSDNKLRSRS